MPALPACFPCSVLSWLVLSLPSSSPSWWCVAVQHYLVASTGADRSVVLYDVRTDSALRKVVLATNSNALAW